MSIEELKRPERIDEDRIEKLKELFPEAFKDGKLDLNVLQEEMEILNEEISEGMNDEFYELQWSGKRNARRLAVLPAKGTLQLIENEGVNESNTKNVIIEGENLEVLKSLNKSYANKVKVIFIDPPYNTGNDFVYKDNYKEPLEKFLQETKQADEDGLLTSNPKAGGRFHANWLNMMYPRLKLAKSMLRSDGCIFVSIDDNEQANLKIIMDEIFGEENFIANVIWQHSIQPKGYLGKFSDHHNHILVYSKSSDFVLGSLERTEEHNKAYSNPDNDPNGKWRSGDVRNALYRPNLIYDITSPSGKIIKPPKNGWRWSKETVEEKMRTGEIIFNKDETNIIRKIYLKNLEGRAPETIWFGKDVGTTRDANRVLKDLFDNDVPFDTPKPVDLIKRILQLSTSPNENHLVMDFFAGSGTTGQAVLEQNKDDGGNRQFILVQIFDKIDNGNFTYISDITKERLRRSISKLNEEDKNVDKFDRGFKVFRMDVSNIRKWNDFNGKSMVSLNENIDMFTMSPLIEGAKEINIVIELMLYQGFPLDSEIKKDESNNNSLWIVHHEEVPFSLVVCLNEKLQKETEDFLLNNFENATFICLDDALTNKQKILLSEAMNVKTI